MVWYVIVFEGYGVGCGVFLGVVCCVFGVWCRSRVCFRAMLLSVVYCRVCSGLCLGCGVVFESLSAGVCVCKFIHICKFS